MEVRISELEDQLQLHERAEEVGRVGGWRTRAGAEQFLQLTPEARRILGFHPNVAVRNLDLFNVIHPDDRDFFLKTVWAARADLLRGAVDVRVIRDDNSRRVVRITVGPLIGEEGSLTGIVQDVTDEDLYLLDDEAARRLRFERELLHGIDHNELYLEYQPIRSLQENRYIGVEALVRWRHPELGNLPPGAFINVAEETGAIVPLGAHVLQQACRELRRWLDHGAPPDLTMSVNLSAAQFRTEGFVEILSDALADSGVSGSALALEMTESLLVEGALGVGVIESIRAQGVRIAIDDFGTKYSSLSYLTHLKVDALKVDESFVRSLDDEAARTVVTAITALGHALGLFVIAEGVETDAQLEVLRGLGCEAVQGFLFAPPLDGETCLALLIDDVGGQP